MASPVVSLTCASRALISKWRYAAVIACGLQLMACGPGRFVSRQSGKLLGDSNLSAAHVGISIYDAAENKYLYRHQADKYFIPASNAKLYTCYAAMKYLGDSLPGLKYLETDSVLYIEGTGDPSLLAPDFSNHPVLAFLSARKPKPILLSYSNFRTSSAGSGWSGDDYAAAYASERNAFPIHLNLVKFRWLNNSLSVYPPHLENILEITRNPLQTGISVSRERHANRYAVRNGTGREVLMPYIIDRTGQDVAAALRYLLQNAVTAGPFPTGVKPRLVVRSQPTDSLLKPMMHRSDNFFAEQALLMVANEMLGEMNETKLIDSLLKTDLKTLPQKPRWEDGSGLSRYNLFSPDDMVTVLHKMKNEFEWNRITTILPTGGEGTLASYYSQLKDRIYAKTGTLSNNIALSGFLITRHNKILVFSVLVNNHMGNTTQIRKAVERFLVAVAEKY